MQQQRLAPPPASSAAPGSSSAEQRSTEFRAVQGGGRVQPGGVLMVEAYAAIWLCALGLILLGMRRLRKIEARLSALASELDRARDDQPSAGEGTGTG